MGWDKKPSDFIDVIDKDRQAMANEKGKELLIELLGEDVSLVGNFNLDPDEGKFDSVDAPEHVLVKIREAGFLLES